MSFDAAPNALDRLDERSGAKQILILDVHHLRRAGLVGLLSKWAEKSGIEIISVSPPTNETDVCSIQPVMLIVSLGGQSLRDLDTRSSFSTIKKLFGDAPIVIMSDVDEGVEAIEAFRLGASAYIPSTLSPNLARNALSFILHGGTFFPASAILEQSSTDDRSSLLAVSRRAKASGNELAELTNRQHQVVQLLRQGLSNKVIARQLNLTEATVKVHVRQIMRKLGASNRTQAAVCALAVSEKEIGENCESDLSSVNDRANPPTNGSTQTPHSLVLVAASSG